MIVTRCWVSSSSRPGSLVGLPIWNEPASINTKPAGAAGATYTSNPASTARRPPGTSSTRCSKVVYPSRATLSDARPGDTSNSTEPPPRVVPIELPPNSIVAPSTLQLTTNMAGNGSSDNPRRASMLSAVSSTDLLMSW